MEYTKILQSLIGFFSLTLMSLITYAYLNDRKNIKDKQDMIESRQSKFEEQFRAEMKEIKENYIGKYERLMENLGDLKIYIERKFNELKE